jgi:subtilase-type serine protease
MNKAGMVLGAALAAPLLGALPAQAQITYQTLQAPGTTTTGVTGIRGDNITGSFSSMGGLLYRIDTGQFQPYPVATANGANFPGAQSSQPYSPTFGSPNGILRAVGTFTPIGGSADSSYIWDNAAAPGQQATILNVPGGSNTIAHSQFGNQVVGNFNTTSNMGTIFNYNIATGSFTTISVPGASSSSAYGIWADRIAGGFSLGGGHAFIYNQTTGAFTTYNAPGVGVIDTHFEGITAGGRANEFNLAAVSADITGVHSWAVHVDANGVATWTELQVGSAVTFANSIYEDKPIGIFIQGGITSGYIATVAGLYTPVTNTGQLTLTTPGIAISAVNGDDVLNTGVVTTTAPGSIGIASGNYSVIQNRGIISAQGAGSAAVQMNGQFSTFLNGGIITAAPGAFALQTGPTAVGTMVVNNGIIDGQVAVNSGPFTRFENSGLMGISAPGSGTTNTISGVFVQTPQGAIAPRIGATSADLLLVNGQARLAGGVLANFQGTSVGKSYTILTATGGYTGTFHALATQNMAGFLSANLSYGPTSVTLGLQSGFANTPGLQGDQLSTGRALDWAFNAGPGLSNMPGLFTLSASQIPGALTTLSGDSASLQIASSFSAGGQFAGLMTSRPAVRRAEELAQAPCNPEPANACQAAESGWGFWANGFGGTQWLNADSVTGAPTSQFTIGGGGFGADYRVGPNMLVGLAAGLSSTNYWMPTSGASGYAVGAHFGAYGAYEFSGFYANAALAYSNFSNNQTRFITGIGTSETEQSSGTANQFGGRIEVGRLFNVSETVGGQVGVTPFLALQPFNLWTPTMSEKSSLQAGGTGAFGLTYQSGSTFSLPLFLGTQVDGKTEIGGKPLGAWVRAAWVHEFLTDRSVAAGFNVLPGTNFTVDGARAASDAARIDLGVKYQVGSQTSLFANGDVELSGRGQSLAGTVGLRFIW